MGLLTNLFKLVGPIFPQGFCPTTYQQLSDEIINGTQLTFLIDNGNFLYNFGETTPEPENRIYPWLYTPNGRWYQFKYGLWISPMDPTGRDPTFRKMWAPAPGTPESFLWALDGGDGSDPGVTPPTITTGAAWAVDHNFDGIFPVGAGAIPGGGGDSISISTTGGEYKHTLTEAEGAQGAHEHPLGIFNPSGDDAFFRQKASTVVANYTGRYIAGSGVVIPSPETTADIFTLPPNNGNGATSQPFKIYPQYRGVYWVKPTAKAWYTLPA